MATYLDDIVAFHRRRAEAAAGRGEDLAATAAGAPPPRPFAKALSQRGERPLSVIAEIKRRSPSRGDLAPGIDPASLARAYEAGGAACLSVLTDGPHFGGSREDLEAARAAVSLPVLRKDFTVAAADLYEARAMGADAVLLIAAVLSGEELSQFLSVAGELGLGALVEVHDEAELEAALSAGAELVGVNQRDLRTFEIDREVALRLSEVIPASVTAVVESGVRDAADVAALAAAGYTAVLIGETLVTSPDPAGTLGALLTGVGALTGRGA